MPIALLADDNLRFPDPQLAEREPNGLLAVGGDLSVPRLLIAYSQGIFPWYDADDQPILWWSPDPRAILFPDELSISRSLRRRLKRQEFVVRFDTAFEQVIDGCAKRRGRQRGTWITASMREAYLALHRCGYAHSVESWSGDVLAGGLYGISLGRMFFGESMFSDRTDASKVALAALAARMIEWDFDLIDCQVLNPHLESLGADEMSRAWFLKRLRDNQRYPTRVGPWTQPDAGHADIGPAADHAT